MNYFKNYGPVKNFRNLVKYLEPTIALMSKNNMDQFGVRGRMNDNDEPFYGEGRNIPGTNLSDWSFWKPGFEDGLLISILGDYANLNFGRIRIMRCPPHRCYSWHRDLTPRLHIPLITTRKSMLVVENEVKHLTKGNLWWVDTRVYHTAFNGSEADRYHIVYEVDV